jgi:hypothetical protein
VSVERPVMEIVVTTLATVGAGLGSWVIHICSVLASRDMDWIEGHVVIDYVWEWEM